MAVRLHHFIVCEVLMDHLLVGLEYGLSDCKFLEFVQLEAFKLFPRSDSLHNLFNLL